MGGVMIRALQYNNVISNRSRFGYLHMYINGIFQSLDCRGRGTRHSRW